MNTYTNEEEKRRFFRMIIDVEMNCRTRGSDHTFTARCKNMSHIGIQIETDEALSEGTVIDMNIDTKNPKFAPMSATLTVLRVEASSDSKFLVACKMDDIS